jgi:hypothetical protein
MNANFKNSRIVSVILLDLLPVASPMLWGKPDSKQGENGGFANTPEGRIEPEVGHELRVLPFFSLFDNRGFKVNSGRVELTGQVVNPAPKEGAENA